MTTTQTFAPTIPTKLNRVIADLKLRLQQRYEQAYPELGEIIRLVLDEEEVNARKLFFPHLFLPDLVEAHVAKLNLQPATAARRSVQMSRERVDLSQQLAA
jgi:hypothetical protein